MRQKCHVKIKAKCHNYLVKVSQMTRVPQVEYHCSKVLTKGAYNWVSKYLKYVVDMVKYCEKMVKFLSKYLKYVVDMGENGEMLFFLKNGEMVKMVT